MSTALAAYDVASVMSDYRNSLTTFTNSSGALQDADINTFLLSYDASTLLVNGYIAREGRTNYITNPRGEGLVAGTSGNPSNVGTPPTNWNFNEGVLSVIFTGQGQENGIDYVELQLYSAALTGAGPYFYYFDTTIAPILNQTYTADVGIKLVSGSMNGISGLAQIILEQGSAGTTVATTSGANGSITSIYQRLPPATKQVTSASTLFVKPGIRFTGVAGAAVNATIRFYLPQMQQGTTISGLIRPPAGAPGATVRGADDLRLSLQSAWLDAATNTFLIEALIPQAAPAGQDQGLFRLDDGSESNSFRIVNLAGGTSVHAQLTLGGTLVSDLVLGAFIPGQKFRAVAGYALVAGAGVAAGLVSGGNYAAGVPTIASVPTFSRALLGRSSLNAGRAVEESARHLNGYVSEVMFAKGTVLSEDAMLYMSQMNKTVGVLLSQAGVVLGGS